MLAAHCTTFSLSIAASWLEYNHGMCEARDYLVFHLSLSNQSPLKLRENVKMDRKHQGCVHDQIPKPNLRRWLYFNFFFKDKVKSLLWKGF